MKKKTIIIGLVAIMSVLSLAGCGGPTVKDLQAENETLLEENVANEEKIESLEKTIKMLNGEEVSLTGISNVEDGSGKQTFNSVGGKIMFNTALEHKNSKQAPNTSSLKLADRVTIIPSDNWVIQFNGTTTKYSHPNGIHGTIKISTIDYAEKVDVVENEMLQPFLDEIPNTGVLKSTIYLEELAKGSMATVTTLNNNKPAVIKCGLVGNSDIGLVFTFYYDGDKDSTKDEIINSLIKSIQISNRQLRIE